MKITLHLEGDTEEMAKQCLEFVQSLQPKSTVSDTTGAAPKAKPKKAKAAPVEEEEEEIFEEEIEEEEESVEDEEMPSDEEEDGEAEETEDEEAADITIEDVRKAFHTFSKKSQRNRDLAIGYMKKLGVKDLKKLKPAQFASALAMVSGKK